jgi:Peptidase family M23
MTKKPARVLLVLTSLLLAATALAQDVAPNAAAHPQPPGGEQPRIDAQPVLTPLVLRAVREPIPFIGSDGRYHLVYELEVGNYSGDTTHLGALQVVSAKNGARIASLDAAAVAARLVVRDRQAQPGQLSAAQFGLLYLHVIIDRPEHIPDAIEHRLAMTTSGKTVGATAARVRVGRPTALLLDAPLHGTRFIAGDGCCDSVRHVRATLSLNGGAYTGQRFAIDWEQLDAQDRIYVGDRSRPSSYVIYNKPAYAVADARVAVVVDGLPDSPIGTAGNVPLEQADGNHVILDLGDGRFALYAHFAPHSIVVTPGQHVHRGQVLGRVGTSGNSSEPHLHFQVMNAPSALLCDGLPYLLRRFSATRRGASTTAFDQAASDGKPLASVPLPDSAQHANELPLDLWITDLP